MIQKLTFIGTIWKRAPIPSLDVDEISKKIKSLNKICNILVLDFFSCLKTLEFIK